MERNSKPIMDAIRALLEKQARQQGHWSELHMALVRALEAAERHEWEDVRLLLAQAEDAEERVSGGESPCASGAWDALGFPPDPAEEG